MTIGARCRTCVALGSVLVTLASIQVWAQRKPDASSAGPRQRDGQHDFDFEFGTWKVHLSRRLHPLTGSTTWTELDGRSVVRKVWNGRANLGELEVDGPSGHIEGLSFR